MAFHCICMSPAIDATVTLPAAPRGAGEIFKDVAEVENVGGKAVNVARWLALRGAKVSCGGLLGEDNAAPFEKELARYGIEDRFQRVPGPTRRNEMFVWPGGSFKVNRTAFGGMPAVTRVPVAVGSGDVVVVSGSLPKCCAASFYADMIAELRQKGAFVVFDASGAALANGVAAKPDVIKPNAEECEALVGFVPKTPDGFRKATDLLRASVRYPIISDGAGGCWFDGEFVPAPAVEVVDTTAAGDTLLAEWVYRSFSGADGFVADREAARWAVAAGSAACLMPGGEPPSVEQVGRLYEQTKVN